MNVTLYTDAETRLRDAARDLAEALAALLYASDEPELILKARAALAKAGVTPSGET